MDSDFDMKNKKNTTKKERRNLLNFEVYNIHEGSKNKTAIFRNVIFGKPACNRKDRRGLFQNGVLTRNFTRGLRGAHDNARIDEDLHTLIKLANKSKIPDGIDMESNAKCQSQDRILEAKMVAQKPTVQWICPEFLGKENYMRHSADLDVDLFSDFVRAVNQSLIFEKESKFTNKNYSKRTKMHLVQVYLNWVKNDQCSFKKSYPYFESGNVCGVDLPSVESSTSPLSQETPLNNCNQENDQKMMEFVQHPYKTTREFLEETLGPGLIPSPSAKTCYQNYPHYFYDSKPYLKDNNDYTNNLSQSSVSSESGLSVPLLSQFSHQNDQHSAMQPALQSTVHTCSPKMSNFILLSHQKLPDQSMQYLSTEPPFSAANPPLTSIKSFQNRIADGYRNILCDPSPKTLLPFMLKECSPEFRYYPRRMF